MKMISNKKNTVAKGIWKDDWMEARFRDLGDFTLLMDTTAPRITLYGWLNGGNVSKRTSIAIVTRDNLGDVKNANGYVDGKWILFSKKDDLLVHTFDGRITAGKHELKVIAEDEAGNISEKIFTFTR